MGRAILLDSRVAIPHLRRRFNLNQVVSLDEALFLPLTALGELYKGVLKSNRVQENRLLLEEFLETVSILNPDMATARCYAQVSADLEKRGVLIPENDIWIAATALEFRMPLATRDAHFARVPGLQLLQW